jgi:hypothetical protein
MVKSAMTMSPDLTFITPISLPHKPLAERAIASVHNQTVRAKHLTMLDTDKRGPGYLRNLMLRQVDTEFTSFLDADDWIEPTFAEETIAEYRRIGGDRYIYVDWFDNLGRIVQTPCLNGPDGYPLSVPDRKPFCGGTWHPITTLIPTDWLRQIKGFDEGLPASEDTEMYLKLCTTLRCGHHLARPLFHYAPGGGRAIAFREGPDRDRIAHELTMRYGGRMGCCGNDEAVIQPIGQKQEGDVLAMALWHGNRGEYGRATGRHYPRISIPKTAWVDARDCAMSPNLWKVLPTVDTPQPMTTVQQLANAGLATVKRNPYAPPVHEPPPPPVEAKPDVSRVIRLAQQAQARTADPVFVFPEKVYPSYSDFRRLVELSGYRAVTFKQMDFFSRAPYIVVSPEPLPQLSEFRASIIAWQLEYAGDYAHNYDGFTGEVWASDKAWADAHGAKYVILGSHPGLSGEFYHNGGALRYDVTMLGYMTPRRQVIKSQLSDLSWPADYPGHATPERDTILKNTRIMLNVHQHDNAPYIAPQRIALAAAFHMYTISEFVPDFGALSDYLEWSKYDDLPVMVRESGGGLGDKLHQFLCVEQPFRKCVEEALKH